MSRDRVSFYFYAQAKDQPCSNIQVSWPGCSRFTPGSPATHRRTPLPRRTPIFDCPLSPIPDLETDAYVTISPPVSAHLSPSATLPRPRRTVSDTIDLFTPAPASRIPLPVNGPTLDRSKSLDGGTTTPTAVQPSTIPNTLDRMLSLDSATSLRRHHATIDGNTPRTYAVPGY